MPVVTNFLLYQFEPTAAAASAFPINWAADTFYCALFTSGASSYICNSSGYTYWSTIGSGEIGGMIGYTASGQAMSGLTIGLVDSGTTSIVKMTANDNQWASSTTGSGGARLAVIYKKVTNGGAVFQPTNSPVVCWVDFGSDQLTSNGTFDIQWNASGIIQLSASM